MKSLKAYFENEYTVFRHTVGKLEYASWWVVRVCMLGALLYWLATRPDDFAVVLLSANFLATFAVPLARIIFFRKLFIGKIPFRIQSFINVFVFLGSFLGHGFRWNSTFDGYDKILHVVSGAIVVFIGYELLTSFKNSEHAPNSVMLFGAAGFSFTVMVIWEIFEFFCDYFIEGSENQWYTLEPSDDMLFFKIFGQSVNAPDIYHVMDTDLDLLCAVIGCSVGSAILYAYLSRRAKKAAKAEESVSAKSIG